MNALWTDPVSLVAAGIIVFTFVLFVFGVRILLKKPSSRSTESSLLDKEPPQDLAVSAFNDNPFTDTPVTGPEPVNRAMAEKLALMTQRLADMQVQLNRQTAAVATANAAALPPETLDKMVGTVNTVIQQIDAIQKSLNTGGSAQPSAPAQPVTPSPQPPPPAIFSRAPATPPPTVPVSEIVSKPNPPT